VAAITGPDPLFEGEYVTGHALTIVNMVVRDQFEDSNWELIEISVEGSDASTHYTLRTQRTPDRPLEGQQRAPADFITRSAMCERVVSARWCAGSYGRCRCFGS